MKKTNTYKTENVELHYYQTKYAKYRIRISKNKTRFEFTLYRNLGSYDRFELMALGEGYKTSNQAKREALKYLKNHC